MKGNAAIITGSAGGDALENHEVFHNREGAGRVSLLQEVTIGALTDTDGDGLKDGVETKTGVFVNASNTGSDPNIPDTDGDNLGDGEEVAVGRNPVDPSDGRTGLDVGLTAYWSFDNTLNDVIHGQAKGDSTVADNGVFTGEPDLFTGANPGAGGREWNGEIDDAAVWNRPLTEAEVAEIHAAGTGADSLGTLIGLIPAAAPIAITAYSLNQATKEVTLTWTSAAATDHTVRYSVNLTDWTGVAVETAAGDAGFTTRSFTVPAAVPTAGRVFFRVQAK